MEPGTVSTRALVFYRLRNVALVLLAVGLGVVVPHVAHVVESVTLLIVTFLMYSSFRGTTITRAEAPRYLLPILVVLAITYVAIPIVGISCARFLLSGEPLVGIAAVLSAPATAGSAIVWTRSSDGNDELSGLTSASSIVLAPLLTPLVLAHLLHQPIGLPLAKLEFNLFLIIVASIVLLVLVPNETFDERTIDLGSEASIFLLIYAGVGTAGLSRTSTSFVFEIGLVAIAVFTVGFATAFAAAMALGSTKGDFLAMFFSGTLKNLGISLLVVLSFATDVILLTVIVYYVCQQLFSAVFVDGTLFARDVFAR